MRRKSGPIRCFVLTVALLFMSASTVHADILEITYSGSGSGTLNGAPFSNLDFVITAFVDTDDRDSPIAGVFVIEHIVASIQIDSLGTFDFLVPTLHFVNNNIGSVGFSRAGPKPTDLFSGPSDAAFETWDMLEPIGPISGNDGWLLQWDNFSEVVTTGGVLIFDEETSIPTTFTASQGAIPEPVLGDANDDGELNNLDIASFVLALTSLPAYQAMFPNVDPDLQLDMDGSGAFNNFDIAGFVAALAGG